MNTTHQDEFVSIGKVLRARGLKGEVKVLPLTDIPDRFTQLDAVYVTITPEKVRRVAIEHVSYYKRFAYLRFQGCNSLAEIEEFIGKALQVKRAASPELPDGVYYHYEILDSEVYTEENQRLGTVIDIIETGAHDVYVVQGDEREYLIPVTRDIVTQIDREKRIIIVNPIEGLLDL